MNATEKFVFQQVDGFFERVVGISGILDPKKMTKERKREIIREKLKEIEPNDYCYLPSNPYFKVVKIKVDSGNPM